MPGLLDPGTQPWPIWVQLGEHGLSNHSFRVHYCIHTWLWNCHRGLYDGVLRILRCDDTENRSAALHCDLSPCYPYSEQRAISGQGSKVTPNPKSLNPTSQTLNPKSLIPTSLNPASQTLNPKSLNPTSQTLHPKSLNPTSQTLKPQIPKLLGFRLSQLGHARRDS